MVEPPEPLTPLPPERFADFKWLAAPHLQKIIAALEAREAGAVRFVGGCVRDSLLGVEPKDFDIATTLTPDEVVAALASAGLKSAPTGIEHGTVTAIADHQGVEVTTLRADVSTDGRRATVAFTREWRTDAERRDFRLNAIYLTPDAQLFDPVGGIADCEARRVRFIGDARQRIEEDYLRILRFFRFSARLANDFDADGLRACVALKDGLTGLSAERIGAEMMAILSLPRASFAVEKMAAVGILSCICSDAPQFEALARLKTLAPGAPAALALAALFADLQSDVGTRLRLSNAQKAMRLAALDAAPVIESLADGRSIKTSIYRLGHDVFSDATRLAFARGAIVETRARQLLELNEGWRAPVFPVSGKDILAQGVKPGPDVARLLGEIETRWIDEEFPDERRAREILAEIVGANQ